MALHATSSFLAVCRREGDRILYLFKLMAVEVAQIKIKYAGKNTILAIISIGLSKVLPINYLYS